MHAHARKDRHFITPNSHMVTCDNERLGTQEDMRKRLQHWMGECSIIQKSNWLKIPQLTKIILWGYHVYCIYISIAVCYNSLKF